MLFCANGPSDMELGTVKDVIPTVANPLHPEQEPATESALRVGDEGEDVGKLLDQVVELDNSLVYQFAQPVFHVDTYMKALLYQTIPHVCMIVAPLWFNYTAMGYYSLGTPSKQEHS